MWTNIIWLVTCLGVQTLEAYNMEPITHSSLHPNETDPELATPLPTLKDILMEFESRRSPDLQVMPGRLRREDVVDLCEAVNTDDSSVIEKGEKKLYYFIPVTPKIGNLPSFTPGCYGWKRKPCLGIPKPPFDYRCAFWSPQYHPGEDHCAMDDAVEFRKNLDAMTLNGLEAVSLCASVSALAEEFEDVEEPGMVRVTSVAVPTNEATDLRCINWIASPEGGWIKEKLTTNACQLLNKRRPSPYIDNEIDSAEGTVTDIYSDVIKCQSMGNKIDCVFLRKFGVLF